MRAIVLAVALSLSAEGATAFRVRGESDAQTGGTRVTVAGDDICIEPSLVPGAPLLHNALVSRDGGATFIAINHENRTWYVEERPPLVLYGGSCCGHPKARASKVKWLFTEPERGRYVATLTYVLTERFEDIDIHLTCNASLDIRTTDAYPRSLWPVKQWMRTGYPDVDAKIAPDLGRITGFPTRLAVTTRRQYEGGPLLADKAIVSIVDDVRTVSDAMPPKCGFPPDYREQKPVIAAPGMGL